MKHLYIDIGSNTWILMDKDSEVKRLLYERFEGDKELIIRDSKGNEIDKLRLDELYTK